jgi:hypothetical protein
LTAVFRLKRAHGGDAVILIDEYDTPLLHAHSEKYFDGAVKLLRPWLGAALNLKTAVGIHGGASGVLKTPA